MTTAKPIWKFCTTCAIAAFSAASLQTMAQGTSYYEDTQYDPFQRQLYFVGKDRPHTTIRSYRTDELRKYFDPDSVLYAGIRKVNTRAKIINNFLNGDFLAWTTKDSAVRVAINPMFDFEVGKDDYVKNTKTTYVNSRGFFIDGNLGKNFWFYMDFSENQAAYADYYAHLIDSLRVVPGQSNYKSEVADYDFQVANGYVCFNAGKWIDFQVGKTKTFIGDGYRSLLLSDAACAVPTFKMNVTFLSAKYTMMVTQLRASEKVATNSGQKTKYSFSHFLDWNMGRRFTLGLFENVTMATWRKTGESRGIDWEYLNPFIIFRPGEYNAGSPDKMLIGMTGKFVCTNWLTLYGQVMVNEFRLKELLDDKGYWSNKYGFQMGVKMFNIINLPGLDFQAEYNQVRPFCYSQYDALGTYTHHKQSMGHALGANLKEGVFILNYKHRRASARMQANIIKYGDDFPKDSVSYGHNPNIASTKRKSQYNVFTTQGLLTDVKYFDLSGSFIINPKNMMNIAAGLRIRTRKSDLTDEKSKQFYVALRWSLKSKHFDY